MLGFYIIINKAIKIGFFIGDGSRIYHFRNNKFSTQLDHNELELINKYGKDTIISMVKHLNRRELVVLDKNTTLQRFY